MLDNNIVVIGFLWGVERLFSVVSLSGTKSLYKLPEADIYHSEAPSIDSWLAMKHNPKAKHIIKFQDPRTFEERWKVLSLDPEKRRTSKKYRYKFKRSVLDIFVKRAIKNADGLYCQARFIIPKVVEMFGLDSSPMFSPNPVDVPKRKLKKADIFLFPSIHEGFPKVTIEAAATGLPSIVFKTYKPETVLNGETGYIVRDIDEMMEKLKILIEDAELRHRMGVKAREYAKKFDWNVITKQWEKEFTTVLEKGKLD